MKNKILILSLFLLTGCFKGEFLEGQPCQIDDDCGTVLVCEDQICKKEGSSSSTEAQTTQIDSTTEKDPTTTGVNPTSSTTTGITTDLPEEKNRYIFVTSFPVQGMPFPDNVCNIAAGQGILKELNLNFKPLINYKDESKNNIIGFESRYLLFDGSIFVDRFSDIEKNIIVNSPSIDEYGKTQSIYVWTGNNEYNCEDWSYLSNSSIIGKSDDINLWWDADVGLCIDSYHLYCIED